MIYMKGVQKGFLGKVGVYFPKPCLNSKLQPISIPFKKKNQSILSHITIKL